MGKKAVRIRVVGQIAAALAGYVELFAQLFVVLGQGHMGPGLAGAQRGHHARGAAADNNDLLHFSPCTRSLFR